MSLNELCFFLVKSFNLLPSALTLWFLSSALFLILLRLSLGEVIEVSHKFLVIQRWDNYCLVCATFSDYTKYLLGSPGRSCSPVLYSKKVRSWFLPGIDFVVWGSGMISCDVTGTDCRVLLLPFLCWIPFASPARDRELSSTSSHSFSLAFQINLSLYWLFLLWISFSSLILENKPSL